METRESAKMELELLRRGRHFEFGFRKTEEKISKVAKKGIDSQI